MSFKNYRKSKKGFFSALALSSLLTNVMARPDFISVNAKHVKSLSFRLCVSVFGSRGFVWTVRTPEQHKLDRRLGLFSIFEKIRP
jgi:hypothetical protein